MRFARTDRNRWRFLRDAPTVPHHPSAGRPGLSASAPYRHRRSGQSPTTAALITLYVAGLILLDGRQTQTRVALFLPGRAHDALNRLSRVMPLSTRALMGLLVVFCKERHEDGYLCIDDVVVEKAFARKLSWAGWTYSFAKKHKVYGLCTWSSCSGAAPTVAFASLWPSACGGPNARARHASTGPSSGWRR
jgi:hypothetical protein